MTREKKQFLEKVINIILNILIFIFAIFLLISIYNNIQVKILGNDYSSFFGYSMFEVQTGSMSKAIEAGDMIVVKKEDDIEINDIITFKQGNDFVTHRVVEIYNDTLVTRGDANNTKDDPITKSQVVGKVVKILPGFGIIRKILFNPFVLIALIVTLYLISTMFRRGKSMKIKEFVLKIIKKVQEKLESTDKTTTIVSTPKVEEPIVLKDENVMVNKVQVNEPLEKEEPKLQEEAKEILEHSSPEDLDKTIFFRMVSVDKDDIHEDFKEADLEEEDEEIKESVQKKVEEPATEEASDDEVKSKLMLLQKKRKKCKNIIEKAILLKSEELEEIVKVLNLNQEYKTNEPTIKEYFLKTYIDGKYYNYCGDVNVSYDSKNMVSKIEKLMEDTGKILLDSYNGKDSKFALKVTKFTKIFMLLPTLEKNSLSGELRTRRETYKKKIYQMFKDDYLTVEEAMKMAEEIIKIQRVYAKTLDYIFEKLETNTFKLKYTKLKDQKIYGVSLEHNLSFSKVYSDYIVDKTYKEGIIAEDTVLVLANMLLITLAKDMLAGDFEKKYMLHIPESLYGKENKLNQLFTVLNDEYVKHSVIIFIKYNEIVGNKTILKNFMKEGFSFAMCLDKMEVLKEKDLKFFYLMQYIVINEKKETSKLIKKLPKDLPATILYDDVASKIAQSGGEK